MRYKYIICIACNNNKLKKCVWCGSDFTQEELAYMQKEALGYFNVIVEEQKLFRTNVVVQLVKAETDNWYWNTKKVVIEQEINY